MFKNPFFTFLLFLFLTSLPWACQPKKTAEKAHPSEIENPVKETELTSIKLTPQAVSRLGIETVAAGYRNVSKAYKLGGDIIAVPGKSVSITAPLKGTILLPENGKTPTIGSHVIKGQVLFRLLILPAESDLISLQEDIRAKEVQLETTSQNLKRTEQLLADKAASMKQVEQARADHAVALNAVRTARSKANLLKGSDPNTLAKSNSTMLIRSPVDGILLKVYASTNQTINSGLPIADVADVKPVWVRVPLYEGIISDLNQNSTATIQNLSEGQGGATAAGHLVSAPVTSDPSTASSELYYEIPNEDGKFMPGQKVNVSLALQQTEKNLVVPYAAIVYDMNGGQWVYTNPEPNIFVRKRVEVKNISDSLAVLARGIEPNTKVVTAGAAELFGTEFGGGH
jgi:cobalt-zinc-cadmium efflux system membrane fusion protein